METGTMTIEKELNKYHLNTLDADRLMLDVVERLGKRVEGCRRPEVIALIKRVTVLGVLALAAEDRTETFATTARLSVEARCDRRAATCRDLRYFVRRMLKIPGVGERPLRAMTTSECRELLRQAFGSSLHSYRKGRAILHSIFAYGMRQDWCEVNPVDRIEMPRVQEPTIEPLSLADADRLLKTSTSPKHRKMRFSLLLMLYCGMRPAEVSRFCPARDVLWEEGVLIVRPNVSKTGGGRMVPLRRVAHLSRAECIIPRNWKKRWRELRHDAGFEHWRADTLRHTFATFHAAHFRNLPELQLEMGHRDVNLLRSRYMVPASRRDAEAFWLRIVK